MIACDNDDGCPYEWVCFIHAPKNYLILRLLFSSSTYRVLD